MPSAFVRYLAGGNRPRCEGREALAIMRHVVVKGPRDDDMPHRSSRDLHTSGLLLDYLHKYVASTSRKSACAAAPAKKVARSRRTAFMAGAVGGSCARKHAMGRRLVSSLLACLTICVNECGAVVSLNGTTGSDGTRSDIAGHEKASPSAPPDRSAASAHVQLGKSSVRGL